MAELMPSPESDQTSLTSPCPAGGGSRGQSGYGLVEVLIAIVLMAILMTGATLGLITAIETSGDNQVRQRLQIALASYADSVAQMPYPAGACSDRTAAAYDQLYATWANHWTPPAGISVRVRDVPTDDNDGVWYWDRAAKDFVKVCPAVDSGAHRLTLEASAGAMSVTGQIVKRDPEASP